MYDVYYEVNSVVLCSIALQSALHITAVMTNTGIYALEPPWVKKRQYMSTSVFIESGEGALEAVASSDHAFMVV